MENIDAYFEFEKGLGNYKAEITLYKFKISCSIENIGFGLNTRKAVVYSKNELFDKLGSKFEKELKISLSEGIINCYVAYVTEKAKDDSLELLSMDLCLKSLKKKEDWDTITSDMIIKVPKKVKEKIEEIVSEKN